MTSSRHRFSDHLRSSVLMSVAALAGKALAVLKTVAIAAVFGASGDLDAFWVAFAIPNMVPVFIRSAFVTAFVPFFMRRIDQTDPGLLWRVASQLFTWALVVAVVGCVCIWAWPQPLVHAFAPGLSPKVAAEAAGLMQITTFSLVFVVGAAMLTAVAHCHGRFVAASLESITTNLAVIAVIYGWQGAGVTALALGTVAGFAVQFFVMIYACRAELRQHLRPLLRLRHPLVREFLGGVLPVLIGAVSGIAMGMVSQAYLSFHAPGSVSVFQYAWMIAMLPVEVFAASIQAAFFPAISRSSASDRQGALAAHVVAARTLVFVMVPVSVLLMAMDGHIVRLLFGYGRFGEAEIAATATMLWALSVGIVGRSLAYFNFQALHALGHPWAQVQIGFLQLAMNAAFGWLLMRWFGALGVALGASVSLLVSTFVSYLVLARLIGREVVTRFAGPAAAYVALGVALYAVAYGVSAAVPGRAGDVGKWLYAGAVVLGGSAGLGLFYAAAALLGLPEVRAVSGKLLKKLDRA